MTKVYLVKAEYRYKETDEWEYADPRQIEVFTNRKLAEAYAEYWNIQSKEWNKKFGQWRYKVQENKISKRDYREEVLKLQMEQLPY